MVSDALRDPGAFRGGDTSRVPDPLRVTVLGSATPYPRPDNACSGFLVEGGGARVWVDAGTGTLAELQRYVALDRVDAVWLSHLHADHSADLLTTFYALLYAGLDLPLPLPLLGPPGTADRLAGFLTDGPVRSPVEKAFAVEELYDGTPPGSAGSPSAPGPSSTAARPPSHCASRTDGAARSCTPGTASPAPPSSNSPVTATC